MPDKHHPPANRERDTGTAGATRRPKHPATSLPPDPQNLGRKLTPDEKVDEASLESMDASDSPAYSAPSSGSPKQRMSPKVEPGRNEKDRNLKPGEQDPRRRDDVH